MTTDNDNIQLTPLEEVLGFFECFRRLGFESEQIYVRFHGKVDANGNNVYVELQAQEKTFVVACGRMDVASEEFRRQWLATAEKWNKDDGASAEAWRDHVWNNSYAVRNSAAFIEAFHKKGFHVAKFDPEVLAKMGMGIA